MLQNCFGFQSAERTPDKTGAEQTLISTVKMATKFGSILVMICLKLFPYIAASVKSIYTDGHDQISCCDTCGKIFVTKEAYKTHMATGHSKQKNVSSSSESDEKPAAADTSEHEVKSNRYE